MKIQLSNKRVFILVVSVLLMLVLSACASTVKANTTVKSTQALTPLPTDTVSLVANLTPVITATSTLAPTLPPTSTPFLTPTFTPSPTLTNTPMLAPSNTPAKAGGTSKIPLGLYTNSNQEQLTINGDGTYSELVDILAPAGNWTGSGNQIIFTETSGGHCSGIPGTYTWKFSGKELTFTSVQDACSDRIDDLTSSPWTIQ